jgi:hypothetical protein
LIRNRPSPSGSSAPPPLKELDVLFGVVDQMLLPGAPRSTEVFLSFRRGGGERQHLRDRHQQRQHAALSVELQHHRGRRSVQHHPELWKVSHAVWTHHLRDASKQRLRCRSGLSSVRV